MSDNAVEKPEPNPATLVDSDGLRPDMNLIGTFWEHSGNKRFYQIVEVIWRGTSDTWEYVMKRTGSNMKYSRSIRDFHSNRGAVPRFTQVEGADLIETERYAAELEAAINATVTDGDPRLLDMRMIRAKGPRIAHHFNASNPTMSNTTTRKLTSKEILDNMSEVLKSIEPVKAEATRHTIAGIEVDLIPSPTKLGAYDVRLAHPSFTEQDKKDIDIVMHSLGVAINVSYSMGTMVVEPKEK
jgi:hypothetical protein